MQSSDITQPTKGIWELKQVEGILSDEKNGQRL